MVGEALYPGLATRCPYCTFVQIGGGGEEEDRLTLLSPGTN